MYARLVLYGKLEMHNVVIFFFVVVFWRINTLRGEVLCNDILRGETWYNDTLRGEVFMQHGFGW